MNKVSIIIPVYNAETYLRESIESILAQTYSDWELILLNDCSTDQSGKICEEYAKKDKRIRLLTNETNQGPGFTRNFGIDNSTGEWIYFLDADDSISNDTLSIAVKKAYKSKSDLCVWGYTQYYQNKSGQTERKVECNVPVISSDNIGDIALKLDEAKLFAYVWNKLYRTSVIRDNGIHFTEQQYGEDFLFNISVFNKIDSVCYVNKSLYLYRKPMQVTLSTAFYDNYHLISVDRYIEEKKLLINENTNPPAMLGRME